MSEVLLRRAYAKPLIVIIEDELALAEMISTFLEHEGMLTQICTRAQQALRFLSRQHANLLLLDLKLPDGSGFDVAEQLRAADNHVPIIFLTGDCEMSSKLRALNLGGDDYITKPFHYEELGARVRAVLRRSEASRDANVTKNVRVSDSPFEICGARIVPERVEIEFPDGTKHRIGAKELDILACLNAHRGQLVTRRTLIHMVWGVHANLKSRSLDQYLGKLRDLFQAHGLSLDALQTVYGVGYFFNPGGAILRLRPQGKREDGQSELDLEASG